MLMLFVPLQEANHSMEVNSTLADAHSVAHNHSYPLPPGRDPRPPKQEGAVARPSRRGGSKRALAALPFAVEDIVNSPVEHFQGLLQSTSLSAGQLQLMKDLRRRGKNKMAAQKCRRRKMEVVTGLEGEVAQLKAERDRLRGQRRAAERELSSMRAAYGRLYDDVFRTLRDDAGQPYDPRRFALRNNGDGSVFLVPSEHSDDPPKEAPKRKRKGGRHH